MENAGITDGTADAAAATHVPADRALDPPAFAERESRGVLPGEVTGGGVLLAFVVAFIAQLTLVHVNWVIGLGLYGFAALLFGAMARRNLVGGRSATSPDTAVAGTNTWPIRSLLGFGLAIVLLFLLYVNVDVAQLSRGVWILQGLAIVVIVIAGFIADFGRVSSAPMPTSPLEVSPWTARIMLAAILLGGIWFRFHDLANLPFGFWFDEADVALISRRMVEDPTFRPVFIEVMPGYHGYLIAQVFEWFGESVTAVRSVTAAFGVATIYAGYFAGRELFGRSGGLLLAFLIAFSRWSLTLSRIAMHNVTVPFFALMMLALMLRAYRRRSTLDFVLAGLFAGGGLIFYSAMSASVAALALFAFIIAFRNRKRFLWAVPRFAAGFIAAMIVFAPLGKFVLTEGDTYFARNRITAVWSDAANLGDDTWWDATQDNVVTYGSMTHYRGDPNGRHNLPNAPMFPPVVAGLVVLGLAAAAFRVSRTVGALALTWVPLSLIPGVLSLPWESPNSLRAVAAQPIGLVLATTAVAAVFPVVASSKRLRWAFLALAAVGLGGTAYYEVDTYFGKQADDFGVWAQHSTKETVAATYMAEAPETTHVTAVAFLDGQKSIDFISGQRPPDAYYGTDTQLPVRVPAGKDAMVLAVPETYDVASQVSRLYPGATVSLYPENRPTELITIQIPREAVDDSRGWTVTEGDGIRRQAATLALDMSGLYRFSTSTADSSVLVDALEIADCAGGDLFLGLGAGLHRIIVQSPTSEPEPEVLWIPATGGDWTPIPDELVLQERMLEGGTPRNPICESGQPPRPESAHDRRFHRSAVPSADHGTPLSHRMDGWAPRPRVRRLHVPHQYRRRRDAHHQRQRAGEHRRRRRGAEPDGSTRRRNRISAADVSGCRRRQPDQDDVGAAG